MEDIKLTKLAKCAGCGAKVGAGTLAKLLSDIPTIKDERLVVGYDKSDDASVYIISDDVAIVQTVDFFPPIVDDGFLFGQIAATNAISDVYAMGATPRLAMNVMCIPANLPKDIVHDILRGGYEKAAEAGTIITGGHTIEDTEPKYGLSVTGFVHPKKYLTNSGARPGDVLILTKPLGIGIITTSAKAELTDKILMDKIYRQMCTLNKTARDIMVKYDVHACTDVTGFALMGHSLEMSSGSNVTIHLVTDSIPYHKEAYEFAQMGFIPAGAYRNRDFAMSHIKVKNNTDRAMLDIMYDPQTSGGLLICVSEKDSKALLSELQNSIECAAIVGYVTDYEGSKIIVE